MGSSVADVRVVIELEGIGELDSDKAHGTRLHRSAGRPSSRAANSIYCFIRTCREVAEASMKSVEMKATQLAETLLSA